MAITVLSAGLASNGSESCSWQVDHDSTTNTIGITATGSGHPTVAAHVAAMAVGGTVPTTAVSPTGVRQVLLSNVAVSNVAVPTKTSVKVPITINWKP